MLGHGFNEEWTSKLGLRYMVDREMTLGRGGCVAGGPVQWKTVPKSATKVKL